MATINFAGSTIGNGTFDSVARHRRNSTKLIESIAADSPRYQNDISGVVDGILIEGAGVNSILNNQDLEAANWFATNLTNDSTTESSIVASSTAQEWGEGTSLGVHQIRADLEPSADTVADDIEQGICLLVEYVDAPYIGITYRNKAGVFSTHRFNIDPETAAIQDNVPAAGTLFSVGMEYYGSNVFQLWGSWDSGNDVSPVITRATIGIHDSGGTTGNFTGTDRSVIIHAADSFVGTVPQMFVPVGGTRLTPTAGSLFYSDPGLANDFIIDLTFIGRNWSRASGTPAERVLVDYGTFQLLCTDNDIIADLGSGNRVVVTDTLQQGSIYNVSVSKETAGLYMSVNGGAEVSNTGAAYQADITTGDIYVGSDSSSLNHVGTPISSLSYSEAATGLSHNDTTLRHNSTSRRHKDSTLRHKLSTRRHNR